VPVSSQDIPGFLFFGTCDLCYAWWTEGRTYDGAPTCLFRRFSTSPPSRAMNPCFRSPFDSELRGCSGMNNGVKFAVGRSHPGSNFFSIKITLFLSLAMFWQSYCAISVLAIKDVGVMCPEFPIRSRTAQFERRGGLPPKSWESFENLILPRVVLFLFESGNEWSTFCFFVTRPAFLFSPFFTKKTSSQFFLGEANFPWLFWYLSRAPFVFWHVLSAEIVPSSPCGWSPPKEQCSSPSLYCTTPFRQRGYYVFPLRGSGNVFPASCIKLFFSRDARYLRTLPVYRDSVESLRKVNLFAGSPLRMDQFAFFCRR